MVAARAYPPAGEPRTIRRAEYEHMAQAGVFGEDRLELIRGRIIAMSPKGPMHDCVIDRLNERLVLALHGRATIRVQNAIVAADESMPEPDLAVVPLGDYSRSHPDRVHLIIEVSDSTLVYDRDTKGPLYAASGFPEYWIVNLVDRLLEVRSAPVRDAYTRVIALAAGEVVSPGAFPELRVPVDTLVR